MTEEITVGGFQWSKLKKTEKMKMKFKLIESELRNEWTLNEIYSIFFMKYSKITLETSELDF